MSGSGVQLAPHLAPQHVPGETPEDRSPLAHLLHALNQPLTGLQCSLELAVAAPRPTEQYIRTLHEGLELTGRMRILVEAIRELADLEPSNPGSGAQEEELKPLRFDELVRATATDLLPVAASKSVHVLLVSATPLMVYGDRRNLATLMFRFLESALSLACEGSELRIVAAPALGHAHLVVSWNQDSLPEHSPFSRQELGLLIAQAGWKRAGAKCIRSRAETTETCTVRFPLTSPLPH
jgi:hypothetical protein